MKLKRIKKNLVPIAFKTFVFLFFVPNPMPPRKAGPAHEIVQVKITPPHDACTTTKCSHGSYAIICVQCKAEQDAVDMFLI